MVHHLVDPCIVPKYGIFYAYKYSMLTDADANDETIIYDCTGYLG